MVLITAALSEAQRVANIHLTAGPSPSIPPADMQINGAMGDNLSPAMRSADVKNDEVQVVSVPDRPAHSILSDLSTNTAREETKERHSSGHSASATHEKTKEQYYAEAAARVAQELAMHRQKWANT